MREPHTHTNIFHINAVMYKRKYEWVENEMAKKNSICISIRFSKLLDSVAKHTSPQREL